MFLSGASLNKTAQSINMESATLRKIFLKQCGDVWVQKFDVPRFNIHQEIKVIIPPLLSDEKIEAIKARFKQSRQIYRKHSKHPFLLSGMVICDNCGTPYFASHKRHRYKGKEKAYDYYIHDYRKKRPNNKCCNQEGHCINAEMLESSVLVNVYSLIGDKVAIEKALKKATPDEKKLKELEKHKSSIERDIKKAENGKKRIITAIKEGVISNADAKKEVEDINDRIDTMTSELDRIMDKLQSVLSKEQVEMVAGKLKGLQERHFKTQHHFNRMSFAEKRALLQLIFTQNNVNDKRLGIYLKHSSKKRGNWVFRIEGNFVKLTSAVPRKTKWEDYAKRVLGLDESDKLIISPGGKSKKVRIKGYFQQKEPTISSVCR